MGDPAALFQGLSISDPTALLAAMEAARAAKEGEPRAPPRRHVKFVSMGMLLNAAANDDITTAR